MTSRLTSSLLGQKHSIEIFSSFQEKIVQLQFLIPRKNVFTKNHLVQALADLSFPGLATVSLNLQDFNKGKSQ
jgi:hypothetical protein